MNCKNCEYWRSLEQLTLLSRDKDKHYGNCSNPRFIYDGDGFPGEEPYNQLYYGDDEGYSASFETGENFGCIHFKEKS